MGVAHLGRWRWGFTSPINQWWALIIDNMLRVCLMNALRCLDLSDGRAREFLWAGRNTHLYGYLPHSKSSLKPQKQVLEKMDYHNTIFLSSQICRGKQKSADHSASYQIQILLLSGKTLLQWVSYSDLVQDLKQILEYRLGIPYASQRLLHEGKQLEDLYPLSFYNIKINASIVFTLRLRGGAVGQSSTAPTFSYKDVVHTQEINSTSSGSQAFFGGQTRGNPLH